MEINEGGCYATQTNQFPSVGKLQNVSPEEHGDEAQQNALTQQTDTMQYSLSSVPDDYQPTSQRARNSVDSGVGRSSSCNSCSQLSHTEDTDELASSIAQCISVHENCESATHVPLTGTDAGLLTKMGMKIDQSLAEFRTLLRNLELQVQMLQREVSYLKRSPVEISESTPNQPFGTSPCTDSPEIEPTPTVHSQSLYTRDTRLYTDSKIARDRKFEIKKNQMESAKKRPHSVHSPTILKDRLPAHEEEEKKDHSRSQKADLRQQVTDKPRLTSRELESIVKHKLPEFIELTNWEYLVPHLVSVDLSDPATTDYLLNETRTEHKKGVYFYLQVLPSKGPDAYSRLYKCLCDEKKHLGHQTLLKFCNK